MAINQEIKILNKTQAEFDKMKVKGKPGTVRDAARGDVTFLTYNFTGESFRVLHNKIRVIDVIEGSNDTITSTIEDGRFEHPTLEEAEDEIRNLNLIYIKPEADLISIEDSGGSNGSRLI